MSISVKDSRKWMKKDPNSIHRSLRIRDSGNRIKNKYMEKLYLDEIEMFNVRKD